MPVGLLRRHVTNYGLLSCFRNHWTKLETHKMPIMSRIEANYWLHPLMSFYTQTKIARIVQVTPLTLSRWITEQATPSTTWRENFQAAHRLLIKKLNKDRVSSEWAQSCWRYLTTTKPPQSRTPDKPDNNWLKNHILKTLTDEGDIPSHHVLDEALAHGFARAKIYRIAKGLGVQMKVRGFGSKKRSYWTMGKYESPENLLRWLDEEFTKEDRHPVKKITHLASKMGFTPRQLDTAIMEMGLERKSLGFGKNKEVFWILR